MFNQQNIQHSSARICKVSSRCPDHLHILCVYLYRHQSKGRFPKSYLSLLVNSILFDFDYRLHHYTTQYHVLLIASCIVPWQDITITTMISLYRYYNDNQMPGLTLLSLSMSTACHKITVGGTETDEIFLQTFLISLWRLIIL